MDIIICFWCLRPIKQVQWLTLRGGCNNFSREIRNYSFVLPLRPFIWMTLSASLVPKFEQLRLLIFQSHLSSPGSLSEVWSVITFKTVVGSCRVGISSLVTIRIFIYKFSIIVIMQCIHSIFMFHVSRHPNYNVTCWQ